MTEQETDVGFKSLAQDWELLPYIDKRKAARIEVVRLTSEEFAKTWDALPVSDKTLHKFLIRSLQFENKPTTEKQRQVEIEKWKEISELRPKVRAQILSVGVPEASLIEWDTLEISAATLKGFNVPTSEEIETWSKLPKGKEPGAYKSLSVIKHPLLCRWTTEQVIEAMTPSIGKIVSKYNTWRCVREDCEQNAAFGVLRALSTDKGVSPFSGHAYHHARTNVRRPSATAGVGPEAEKRPSRTDAKIVIGTWLSGKWEEEERNRKARRIPCGNQIDNCDLKKHRPKMFYDNFAELKKKRPEKAKEIFAEVRQKLRKKMTPVIRHIKLPSEEVVEIKELTPINTDFSCSCPDKKKCGHVQRKAINFTCPDDFVLCRVQRTKYRNPTEKQFEILQTRFEAQKKGIHLTEQQLATQHKVSVQMVKDAIAREGTTRPLIRESFPLSRLDMATRMELMEYLDREYRDLAKTKILESGQIPNQDLSILPAEAQPTIFDTSDCRPDAEQFQTVEDLIKFIAVSPDFHGSPTAWDIQVEDGYSAGQTVADDKPWVEVSHKIITESKKMNSDLVIGLRNEIELTPEQETVMIESFGLDRAAKKTGAYIAKKFGMLLRLHILRQFLIEEIGLAEFCSLMSFTEKSNKQYIGILVEEYPEDVVEQILGRLTNPRLLAKAKALMTDSPSSDRSISRQRVTQFLEAIQKKLLEAAFNLMFLRRSNPGDAIRVAMKTATQRIGNVDHPLSPLQIELATLNFGLLGRAYDVDEITHDLDALDSVDSELLRAIDGGVKLSIPARREFVKEELIKIKKSLLDAIL